MTPRDWLLLFIAQVPRAPIDPVRVQKGLFLFAQRGSVAAQEAYTFEPYSYGPMSRRLYRDLRLLQHHGLIRAIAADGQRWERFTATISGQRQATRIRSDLTDSAAFDSLSDIRRQVDSLDFEQLLNYVYERHPEYAAMSVFKR